MIRIFIGCAANHEDAESQAVLEWSIRKHASQPVDITWMKLSRCDKCYFGGWDTSLWSTPFSGFRWAIPEMCNFEGKAIYMDSDVIVMDDIAKLWEQDIPGESFLLGKGGGHWRICVSMFDCAKAKQHVKPISEQKKDRDYHKKMGALTRRRKDLVSSFYGNWNCLDNELKSETNPKAIHYTYMASQPQLRHAIPRLAKKGENHWYDGQLQLGKYPEIDKLFDELLTEAEQNGYGVDRYTQDPIYGEYHKKSYKGR